MQRRCSWCLAAILALGVPRVGRAEPASDARHRLRAAASSSPRPKECLVQTSSRAGHMYGVWRRAGEPRLGRYCDLLAHGYARLVEAPGEALTASERAANTEPRRSAAFLLRARALHTLGRESEALAAFQAAFKADPALRLSPEAQLDYARTASAEAPFETALLAYRQLVPMAGLLTTPGASECVYVEAALLAMRAGPLRLDEAVAYLAEARRRNASPELRPYIWAALALALDRQGRHEEGRGVANEARGRIAWLEASLQPPAEVLSSELTLPRVDRLELFAMIAALAAVEDPGRGLRYWQDLVQQAPPDYPWLSHAKSKLGSGGR